jgi:hypothetical protein
VRTSPHPYQQITSHPESELRLRPTRSVKHHNT